MATSSARMSSSLGEAENRTSDSELVEGERGLGAVDWIEIDGYGVLVNTDEAGTVFVTNFRLLFLRSVVFDALLRGTRPARLWDLYAFTSGPSNYSNTNPKVRLVNEYHRLLGMGSLQSSIGTIEAADARPRKNALANGAMGGGSESSSNYFQCERNGGWTWGRGNLSSMSASVSTLGDSGWLIHVQNVLAGSAWIAARVALESASMLVHCSDGWDRTTQLVALASLLLDPYYRTIKGFQALVEKDRLAFGHPFSDRAGMPNFSGSGSMPLELSRHSSSPNIASSPSPSSPIRQLPTSFTSQAPLSSNTQHSNNYSPIFLQACFSIMPSFLILNFYQLDIEHLKTSYGNYVNPVYIDFICSGLIVSHNYYECTLLHSSSHRLFWLISWTVCFHVGLNERVKAGVFEASSCLWMHLADMRASEGNSHVHYNMFYNPSKHDGPLLPPAAALAPTLWPQFHLRWSCPSEAQSSQVEAQCRNMMGEYSELQKAKDLAESKAREITTTVESLTADLLNESQTDLSVSIAVTADNDDVSGNLTNRFCESLCPLRAEDGGCRWPNEGCARFRSQFIGLKANYDAFDRLSIYDSYFQPE
ncbi:hypothetical protein L1987_34944 [Smallanthus sonchifolius]|uniref:Uncharacterized protein n=1 Tax=Smallanthus sonchifolius TaxID=185202 RepID=A0ACB9HWM8_9ASTR|nr:hypothetical protein L1987_34944 [Smallanthus sonchifolius]